MVDVIVGHGSIAFPRRRVGAPRHRYTPPVRRIAAIVGLASVLVAGCSDGPEKPSLAATASSVVTAPPNGSVVIGDATYAFTMTCFAPGAGAVVASGNGTEPGTGRPTRALVQAFFRDPYVAVIVGNNEVVYEPSLAEPVELYLQDDVVRGGNITFVKNLDLKSRQGETAGLGSVVVTCAGYQPGLPPGYGK